MKRALSILCLLVFTTLSLLSQDSSSATSVDSGFVTVDGGKLFYETAGEGESIVLLHDGTVHREIWDAQFPMLAKNYRVVRYDRRGYGRSPNPQASFSNIDDLHQLFVQLKIDKAVIFGISAGGELAIDFTLKYPGKVSALVLVGTVVSGYGYSPHMLTRGGRINSFAELFDDPQKLIRYIAWEDPYIIYQGNTKAKEKCLNLLQANPVNVNRDKHALLKPADRPAVNRLCEIHAPALILVGEYDIPDVHAHSGVIQFGIPHAKREVIPNSGHLIPLERPEIFNATVLNFLKSQEFFNIVKSGGVNAAAQFFRRHRKSEPGTILFEEGEMNSLGYRYLQEGKTKDAIELFKLNTVAYPASGNAFDSLGEAYLKDGQKHLAIENYKRSLELNPNNTNAKEVLKNVKGTK